MSETDWLESTDPAAMVSHLFESLVLSHRKVRLAACAVCRLVWDCIYSVSYQSAIEAGEVLADSVILESYVYLHLARTTNTGCLAEMPTIGLSTSIHWSWLVYRDANATLDDGNVIQLFDAFGRLQCDAMRDVLGNPYQPMLTRRSEWLTPAVMTLATSAYQKRLENGAMDFGCLLALSDALEESGCDYPVYMSHLREPLPGGHHRGCWAIDWVLGKE